MHCRAQLPLSGGWRSGGTSACPMAEEGFRAAGELFAGRAYPGYANPGLTADYPYRLA